MINEVSALNINYFIDIDLKYIINIFYGPSVELILKNNIAIIPARGGSQGIVGKNLRDFCGKPLIAWTIEQAKSSVGITRVIVSTDCKEIAEVSQQYGAEVPFFRPPEISMANTPIEPVLSHAVNWLSNQDERIIDSLTLLFPTNPLRQKEHIQHCLDLFFSSGADSVITVNESPAHYTPYWTLVQNEFGEVSYFGGGDIRSGYSQRQDFPQKCFAKNDLVFVFKPQNLFCEKSSIYGERVELVVTDRIFDGDINSEEDWNLTIRSFLYLKSR